MTAEAQEAILHEALGLRRSTLVDVDSIYAGIEQIRAAPSFNQEVEKRVKKMLKIVKQQVNIEEHTTHFVSHSCLVRVLGVREATKQWASTCFPLTLFRVNGEELTQAETLALWSSLEYTWDQCTQYFAGYERYKLDSAREPDAAWLLRVRGTLREEAAVRLRHTPGRLSASIVGAAALRLG